MLKNNLAPDIIQCDNGLEFKGNPVKRILEKYKIKMINSRPYHPQSQGKCEISNQVIKKKILFASRRKRGFSWVTGLQNIAFSINTSIKRVLGGLTPFEGYFGRSHTFTNERRTPREIKKTNKRATRRSYRRQLKHAKPQSKYEVGERILVRYQFRKTRDPTKRYILNGKILEAKRRGNYLVAFKLPNQPKQGIVRRWVGVENITSLTIELEKQRKKSALQNAAKINVKNVSKKQQHIKKFYEVLTHEDNLQMLDESGFVEGVTIAHDPDPDGNCQFAAVAHQLSIIGIYRDISTLRQEAVQHVRDKRLFYETFVHNETFDACIDNMSKEGTYDDNLTLIALMREYNLHCLVLSSRGLDQSALVSTDGSFDRNIRTTALGYFPEGFGMHYVSINMDRMVSDQLISTLDCTQNADDSSNTTKQRTAVSDPKNKRGHVRDAVDLSDTDTKRTALKDLKNMINRRRAQGRKTTFPFLLLPIHIQIDILKTCINSNPVMQFVIAKVGEHFRELIRLNGIQKTPGSI